MIWIFCAEGLAQVPDEPVVHVNNVVVTDVNFVELSTNNQLYFDGVRVKGRSGKKRRVLKALLATEPTAEDELRAHERAGHRSQRSAWAVVGTSVAAGAGTVFLDGTASTVVRVAGLTGSLFGGAHSVRWFVESERQLDRAIEAYNHARAVEAVPEQM